MGLLPIVRKKRRRSSRILILGLDNAGKTSIVRNLTEQVPTTPTQATLGFHMKSADWSGCKIYLRDIGGAKAIRTYWPLYSADVDCLIYVVDAADRFRLEECGLELHTLLTDEKLAKVPMLVFANKMDLSTALSLPDVAEAVMLTDVRDRQWHIQACSAKTGEGLREGLEWAVTLHLE